MIRTLRRVGTKYNMFNSEDCLYYPITYLFHNFKFSFKKNFRREKIVPPSLVGSSGGPSGSSSAASGT